MKKFFKQKGFSYLETLMVLVFFGIVSSSVLSLIGTSFLNSYNADKDLIANFLALAYLEAYKHEIYKFLIDSSDNTDFYTKITNITRQSPAIYIPTDFQIIASTSKINSSSAIISVEVRYKNKQITTLKEEFYCLSPIKCF